MESLAVSGALTNDGKVYCWGDDWKGELGVTIVGGNTTTFTPQLVRLP